MASKLPRAVQHRIRAARHWFEYVMGRFESDEPEFHVLSELVSDGDFVLDIGANVGHYTLRFSDLVGPSGHVVAFEPIIETVEILTNVARRAAHGNVSVLNAGFSDRSGFVRFRVPKTADGLPNYYQAHVDPDGERVVLCFSGDDLRFSRRVALIKMDVERHEPFVLKGMLELIERDRPIMIVEGHEGIHKEFLERYGYEMRRRVSGSPNIVFTLRDSHHHADPLDVGA